MFYWVSISEARLPPDMYNVLTCEHFLKNLVGVYYDTELRFLPGATAIRPPDPKH